MEWDRDDEVWEWERVMGDAFGEQVGDRVSSQTNETIL